MSAEPVLKEDLFTGAAKSTATNKTGQWRFLTPEKEPGLSPCRRDCFLDSAVPHWLDAVKRGRWEEAWQVMRERNPFPALTGYVCFHPCSDNCSRGHLGEAVDIPALERAIGQWRADRYVPVTRGAVSRGRVAVVGSGPAGMSCAYYLNEAGYRVTVFEKSPLPGGMFALGIPEYRLPRRILHRELSILEEEGVEFVTNCEVGRDFPGAELYREYDQVFWATGAWLSRRAEIPGEGCGGTWNALDFLKEVNSGRPPDLAETVTVIGGGNAAVDSARTALRLDGVTDVRLIYRRSRPEMPARQEEVEAAEREGVELVFNALPRLIEQEGSRPVAVIFDYCRTGREGLYIDRSRSFSKRCGSVILALGQEADYSPLPAVDKGVLLFAGGDLTGGPATVPEAINAGRVAALNLAAHLEGRPLPGGISRGEQVVSFENLNLEAGVNLDLVRREDDPAAEAGRCLGCGTCNSCGVCFLFCPDLAVEPGEEGFVFNLDYCKGCGICARECPARALAMKGGAGSGI